MIDCSHVLWSRRVTRDIVLIFQAPTMHKEWDCASFQATDYQVGAAFQSYATYSRLQSAQ